MVTFGKSVSRGLLADLVCSNSSLSKSGHSNTRFHIYTVKYICIGWFWGIGPVGVRGRWAMKKLREAKTIKL